MNRNVSSALTTAAIGVAACTAAYMMSGEKNARHRGKQLKRNAGRTVKNAGILLEGVSQLLR